MSVRIQLRRGLKESLPALATAELAFTTDTKELFIGTSAGNHHLTFATNPVDGGSVLVYDTLSDLQAAYPDGSEQPVWIVTEKAWYYWDGEIIDTTPPIVTITPDGLFTGTKTVTISTNESATVYYTLDGTTPTTSSTVYTTPLSISSTTTLKAIARDTAGNQSQVSTMVYTLDTAPTDTTPPNNVTNLTSSNLTQTSVSLSWTPSSSSDVVSYDIFRGVTLIGNVTGNTFNVTGLVASTQYTFYVKAKDGSNNIASGTSVTITTSAPTDTTAPTVTANPVGGTFTSTQSVTLSANETATIYYTTDGSTPTTASSVYSSPISVNATTTLKYFGRDTAGNSSTVQTQTYTINIVPESPHLYFNGTSNYLQIPSMTVDRFEADILLDGATANDSNIRVLIDFRTGGTQFLANQYTTVSGFPSFKVNDVTYAIADNGFANIPKDVKANIKVNLSSIVTDDIVMFAGNGKTQYFLKGKLYALKFLNGATVTAQYDFTTGSGTTLNDISGNGKHATITGATWG